MRKIFIALGVILSSIAVALWYAASPSVMAPSFPIQNVVTFPWVAEAKPLPKTPQEIKVVTYNIGYASGNKNNLPIKLFRQEVESHLAEMAEALKKLDADVIALQEVDFRSVRTFDINQFEYLARALQMPYGAYVISWNKKYIAWPYWPPQIHFGRMASGQAVLSRFPILKQELTYFEKPRENSFWYNWFYLDRIIQKISLKLGDEPMTLWHVHLEPFRASTRLVQAEKLAQLVSEDKLKLQIALGDFNSVSVYAPDAQKDPQELLEDHGESLHAFSQLTGFRNAELDNPFYTMPSWAPVKKIDHIYYSSAIELLAVGNIEKLLASDHLPVWAIFKLK